MGSLLVSISSGSLSPYHFSQHQTPSCIKSVCSCEGDSKGFYDLYLDEDLMKHGHISIRYCPLLFLYLPNDENFNPTTIEILNSSTIQLARGIVQQKIKFELESLENFIVKEVNFADEVTISAKNVTEILILNSQFTLLPPAGLNVQNSQKLSVFNSKFNEIAPAAIAVNLVEEVKIVSNEFSIDTVGAIQTANSPNLYISCNRLLGEPTNKECASVSESSTNFVHSIISPSLSVKTEDQHFGSVNSPLWLLMSIGFVAISIILVCILCRIRKSRTGKKPDDENGEQIADSIPTENVKLVIETESDELIEIETQRLMITESDIIKKIKEQEAILNEEISNMKQKNP